MLSIRKSREDTLEAAQRERFELEAVAHIRDRLPMHHAVLGEQGALEAVREAMAGAFAL